MGKFSTTSHDYNVRVSLANTHKFSPPRLASIGLGNVRPLATKQKSIAYWVWKTLESCDASLSMTHTHTHDEASFWRRRRAVTRHHGPEPPTVANYQVLASSYTFGWLSRVCITVDASARPPRFDDWQQAIASLARMQSAILHIYTLTYI